MKNDKKTCVCTNAYIGDKNNVLCAMVKSSQGKTDCSDVGPLCNHIKPRACDVRGGL